MADTAALVVALSAQLTKFEKDMKDAVSIADRQTKAIENSFSKLNQNINSELGNFVQGYVSRLGPLGAVLGGIGTVGLTIAAGIGVAAVAVGFLNDKVDQFVQKQKAMREAAETTGLTLDQLKAVGQAATRTGVDFEKAEAGIIKMAIAIDKLQTTGTGPLFDALNRLDPQLVNQVIHAGSVAEAFDILGSALAKMEGDFKATGFAADVFGKRNVELLRVLKDLVAQGGLVKAALDLQAAGKGIDEGLNKRLSDLEAKIKAVRKATDDMFGKLFAENFKKQELAIEEDINSIVSNLVTAKDKMSAFVDEVLKYIATKPGVKSANEELENLKVPGLTVPPRGTSPAGRISVPLPEPPGIEFPVTTVLPTARPTAAIDALKKFNDEQAQNRAQLAVDITFLERWMGILGSAATPTERLAQEQAKVNKALLDYAPGSTEATKLTEAGARATARLTLEQKIQADQVRERLLVLTEEEIVQSKLTQAKLEAEKAGIKNIDLTKVEIQAHIQAKEAIEARAVALSKLPQLTRFSLDAQNQFKQLDTFATTTFSNFENSIADVATSTKTLSEAFKSMADSIIKDLVRLTIRMTVTGPLAGALSNFFNPAAAGITTGPNPTAPFFGRQGGGPVSAGHPYFVGEHGMELFVPSSSGQIVPGSLTHGGGSAQIIVNNYAAADTQTTTRQESSGFDSQRFVIDIVKKAQARGELDDANRGRFALRPQKVR